jgi:hypothetical protein
MRWDSPATTGESLESSRPSGTISLSYKSARPTLEVEIVDDESPDDLAALRPAR